MINKLIVKHNSSLGAILCSGCKKIIKTGKDFTPEEVTFFKGEIKYLPPQYCEECTKIISKIVWSNRYSDTMSPDKHGRWMRTMAFNQVPHANINLLSWAGSLEDSCYSAKLHFPTLISDGMHNHKIDDNPDMLKIWCEVELLKYIRSLWITIETIELK